MPFITHTPARAGRREWLALAALLAPTLIVSMDTLVLYFAAPFISRDLHPTATQQLWIVDVYGFALAGLLITMGSLGDRIGRRRLLMLGVAGFGLASLAAALSRSATELIAARAVLGIAGATLAPSTLALIRNLFADPGERRTAIAIWTATFSGGAALGPVVAGVLLEHFGWGSVFLINLPAMALLLVAAPFLLPESRGAGASRVDLVSAAVSIVSVLAVVFAVKQAAQHGPDAVAIGSAALGLVAGVAFLARQRRLEDPLVDLSLFADRGYRLSITVTGLATFAMAGFGLFSTQYLQLVRGLSPLASGLWSLPAPLSVGVAAGLAGALAARVRVAWIVTAGLVTMAGGLALMLGVGAGSALAWTIAGTTVLAFGMGLAVVLLSDVVLSATPADRAGAGAAVSETANELGGALGVAVLGSIGAAVYRHDAIGGAAGAGGAGGADQTLGGAAAAAARLPAPAAHALMHHAQTAFMGGLHAAAIGAGAACLVGAFVAARLRSHRSAAAAAPVDPAAVAA